MNKTTKEWQTFCSMTNSASRLAFARNMKDKQNKASALRFLGIKTAKQTRESKARQAAIAQVKPSEIRRHCQFDGLPNL